MAGPVALQGDTLAIVLSFLGTRLVLLRMTRVSRAWRHVLMTQPHAWAPILALWAPLPQHIPTVYPWQLVQEVRIRDIHWGWKWPFTCHTKDRVLPSHGERRMVVRHGWMMETLRHQDEELRVYTHLYRLKVAAE
jgi:hypothetical protein